MSYLTRPCNECQTLYQAEPRYINRGQGLYCKRACAAAANSRSRKKSPNTICAYPPCEKTFLVKPHRAAQSKSGLFFCNKEHQRLSVLMKLYTPGPLPTESKYVVCTCGKKTILNGLCRSCNNQSIIDQWLAGDNSVTLNKGRNKDTKPFVKKYLTETRGDKCETCGFDEKAPDGRSIIQMDHKDGNCLNNDPTNLQLLCPNHHAMTPNYGSRNKNSGRSHRRQYQS